MVGFHCQVTSEDDENGMWTLAPEPAAEPAGIVAEYWKIGAGGVVSEGSRAHRVAVLTNVEYGATRPGCWMMADPLPPE